MIHASGQLFVEAGDFRRPVVEADVNVECGLGRGRFIERSSVLFADGHVGEVVSPED